MQQRTDRIYTFRGQTMLDITCFKTLRKYNSILQAFINVESDIDKSVFFTILTQTEQNTYFDARKTMLHLRKRIKHVGSSRTAQMFHHTRH